MNNTSLNILTETPWEERNLGVKSFSLNRDCLSRLDQELLTEALQHIQRRFGSFFVFARLPKEYLYLTLVLQQCGFYLVEGAVCPVLHLGKSMMLQKFCADDRAFLPKRFRDRDIHFKTLSQCQDKDKYQEVITSLAAESFSNDRFHEDFQCPEVVANRRFALWIADLLEQSEVSFDVLSVDGVAAGFMARKATHLIIAGFSKKYIRAGLGDYLWLGSLQRMQEQGLRYANTLVSINNIPSLNLHARLGFKFNDPQYSFHRWQY